MKTAIYLPTLFLRMTQFWINYVTEILVSAGSLCYVSKRGVGGRIQKLFSVAAIAVLN